MADDLPISEQFRVVAKKWVDADSAASMLEDTKSSFLSQKMQEQGDMPVSKAEMTVKASSDWKEFVVNTVNARKSANLLKVQLDYLRMKAAEQSSAEATRRAEMKL